MELREEIERILTENAKIMTGMDMDGNGVIEHEMYDEEEVDHDTVKNVTDELIKLFSLHRVSKSYSVQQMDDAYDKGYSDCLKNKAC
tara:strand:- start:673 stop:933 length:261 start_codon:yes stop_codon:yes gene_type:complete